MAEFLIAGNVVEVGGVSHKEILVDTENGVIKKIGSGLGVPDMVAGDDSLIFPGFIDVHVHAREDITGKQNYKEDFKSVSKAALNGGVTCIADMPNNPSPPVGNEGYEKKLELAKKSDVDVLLYAGVGQNTYPLKKNVPYKVFMGQSVGDLFFQSLEELDYVLKRYKGMHVSFHCEDEATLLANKDKKEHEEKRPREAEIKAIKSAIELIKKNELKGKICHCSTNEGLDLVKQAKNEGLDLACEVTPHHMYFEAGHSKGNFLKMNPPLRTGKDRIALIDGVKNGVIDYLATDHAPHTVEDKEKGAAGVPHLDTYSRIAGWLISKCGLRPEDIARVCSYNPGQFVNTFMNEKSGMVEEGYKANLIVLNLEEEKVSKEMIKSKAGWSPFEGEILPGVVEALFLEGRRVD